MVGMQEANKRAEEQLLGVRPVELAEPAEPSKVRACLDCWVLLVCGKTRCGASAARGTVREALPASEAGPGKTVARGFPVGKSSASSMRPCAGGVACAAALILCRGHAGVCQRAVVPPAQRPAVCGAPCWAARSTTSLRLSAVPATAILHSA